MSNQFIINGASGTYNGNGGNDTFTFTSGAVVGIGNILGGDDADTLDFSLRSDNLSIDISGLADIENIAGGSGNDSFIGNNLSNVISGGGGNDTLDGGGLHDTLRGDQGNDQLFGNLGSDFLEGGDGDDLLDGGIDNEGDIYAFNASTSLGTDVIIDSQTIGAAILDFSAGTTAISLNLAAAGIQFVNTNLSLDLNQLTALNRIVSGSQGNDTLTGSTLNDNLQGNGGNDVLNGGDGDDILDGGNDNDTIFGGIGKDTLAGGAGDDSLNGGAGNDTYVFNANDGVDTLNEADGGIDTLSFANVPTNVLMNLGVSGLQAVTTGLSINLVVATTFENLIGGFGDDTLTGNTGANRLDGGAGGNDGLNGIGGDDTYLLNGAPGNDSITDSAGVDTLDFTENVNSFNLDLQVTGAQNIGSGSSVSLGVAVIENIIDGNGDNSYFGNSANNRFVDGPGADFYNGRSGNDTYAIIQGYSSSFVINDDASSGAGTDTLDFSTFTTDQTIDLTLYGTIENAISGSGNDTIFGNGFANLLQGGGGNDTMSGGFGNDTLQGGEGNDKLEAVADNESLVGGSGDDTYTFFANSAAKRVIINEAANAGSDTIDFTGTTGNVAFNLSLTTVQTVNANLSLQLNLGTVIENMIGGNGNDTLTGNTLSNRLTGGAGNDSLVGSSGNDMYLFDADTALGIDTITDASGIDRIDLSQTTTQTASVNLNQATVQVVNPNLSLILTSAATAFEEVAGSQLSSVLLGNGLANVLIGGSQNDSLTGAAGNDTLIGAGGTNTYIFDVDTAIGSDVIDQTVDGNARLDFSQTTTTGVGVNAAVTGTQAVHATNLSLRFVRNTMNVEFVGTNTHDAFIGSLGAVNVFEGRGGSDTLIGSGGADTLQYFRFDADTELDTDGLTVQPGSTAVLDFSNTDTLGITLDLSDTNPNQVLNENLTLSLTGIFTNVFGTQQNDLIHGTSFNDILVGEAGDDALFGGAGRDVLIGGLGSDFLEGGDEDDLLIGSLLFQATIRSVAGLGAIMAEWQRTDATYAQRIDHLRSGTGLNGSSVVNSLSASDDFGNDDQLVGGAGLDWFWLFGADFIGDLETVN